MDNKLIEFVKNTPEHVILKFSKDLDRLKLLDIHPDFKEWIEGTQLFSAIKRHAGTGIIIDVIPENMQLNLDRNVKVEKAEDLPIELIQKLYENSPFYTDNTYNQKQLNLNNESRNS